MSTGGSPGRDRPIFIVGCPRSGTTLLSLMLSAHPRIAIPPETRYLIPAYRRRREFGDLNQREARQQLARFITTSSQFADLGLDKAAISERIASGPPTLGSAAAIVLRAYADRLGKPRWGDKRPGYFQDLDVVLRLFPDAQIVHLIRDGRDCVASLKRMSWFTEDSTAAMVLWVRAMEAGRRARARLSPDSYHELRYEDLVRDPEPALRRLCTFLGEDYADAMAHPARSAPHAVPERKTWHERTRGEVDAAAIGHGQGLEPQEKALMEAMAGRHLRLMGYPVPDSVSAPLALRARYLRVRAVKKAMTARHRAEDRLRDLALRDDVAAQQGQPSAVS